MRSGYADQEHGAANLRFAELPVSNCRRLAASIFAASGVDLI